MFAVLFALLNSPIVWFALLVLSLTGAGVLLVLATRKPSANATPTATPMTEREWRYHNSNQIGR